MSIALVLAITVIIMGNSIIKNAKDKNRVKEYKVIDYNLDSNYVSLKLAEILDASSFMKELVKMSNDET